MIVAEIRSLTRTRGRGTAHNGHLSVVVVILQQIADLSRDLFDGLRRPPLLPMLCVFIVLWVVRTAIGLS